MALVLDFQKSIVTWGKLSIPMKSTHMLKLASPSTTSTTLLADTDWLTFDHELFLLDVASIKDRLYKSINPQEVIDTLDHLTDPEKQLLLSVFKRHQLVFNGKLGYHPTAKIHIDIIATAKPVWICPYPIPFQRKQQFNRELANMVDDGVLKYVG